MSDLHRKLSEEQLVRVRTAYARMMRLVAEEHTPAVRALAAAGVLCNAVKVAGCSKDDALNIVREAWEMTHAGDVEQTPALWLPPGTLRRG